jgi:hypothetical protein
MEKHKAKKKVIKNDVVHEEPDLDYLNDLPVRNSTDRIRDEWDTGGEFADMDFRLVDD